MAEKITFAVAGDPHSEMIHDGDKRMRSFTRTAKREGADFIIHLGDLTYPNDRSKSNCPIDKMPENVYDAHVLPTTKDTELPLRIFESFDGPSYHVMGNHEFDFSSPESILELYDVPNTYYSFHMKGWHFIVIDGNYYKSESGEIKHYNRGDYFLTSDLPYVNRDQLDWLREELKKSPEEPVVFFSHQPLFAYDGGILNLDEFNEVINEARANGKDIKMFINGHMHVDDLDIIDGTPYYNVNSMSNMWVGKRRQYEGRFSEEIEKNNPCLKYLIPYRSAVYSVVTLDDEGVTVKGRNSSYVQPGPRKLGYKGKISAKSRSWQMKWTKK